MRREVDEGMKKALGSTIVLLLLGSCGGGQPANTGGATPIVAPSPIPGSPPKGRLPTAAKCLEIAKSMTWGIGIQEIPPTTIDEGVFRGVPYKSYRSGDYEINVYGDPDNPAGVEIGVYGATVMSGTAKDDCRDFFAASLPDPKDVDLLKAMNLSKDSRRKDGLTFEVSPPNAEDSYSGFWISVFDTLKLQQARDAK